MRLQGLFVPPLGAFSGFGASILVGSWLSLPGGIPEGTGSAATSTAPLPPLPRPPYARSSVVDPCQVLMGPLHGAGGGGLFRSLRSQCRGRHRGDHRLGRQGPLGIQGRRQRSPAVSSRSRAGGPWRPPRPETPAAICGGVTFFRSPPGGPGQPAPEAPVSPGLGPPDRPGERPGTGDSAIQAQGQVP